MVNDPAPQGSERSRAFFGELVRTAYAAADGMEALEQLMVPECRVHLQNGDDLPRDLALEQTAHGRRIFPDLEVDLENAIFAGDWVVIQCRLSGSAATGIPFLPPDYRYTSLGAIVGHSNERLRLVEVWSYMNPGFSLSYPASGLHETPPPDDGAGEAEARALYESWVQHAEAGQDFVSAVADTLAPDGVVHLGNGDIGRAGALRSMFSTVARGLADLSLSIEQVLLSESRVIVQFAMSGRHQGPLGMFPPTGKVLPSRGMLIGRANRRAQTAELWIYIAPGYALAIPPTRGNP